RVVVSTAVLSVNGAITDSYLYRARFTIPYVSGLFYMHEGPFVVAAIEGLGSRPQLLCFDAHGAAHPRSAGLATVAGMLLGIPSGVSICEVFRVGFGDLSLTTERLIPLLPASLAISSSG